MLLEIKWTGTAQLATFCNSASRAYTITKLCMCVVGDHHFSHCTGGPVFAGVGVVTTDQTPVATGPPVGVTCGDPTADVAEQDSSVPCGGANTYIANHKYICCKLYTSLFYFYGITITMTIYIGLNLG